MNKIVSVLISMIVLLAGCGRDLDQSKRYSDTKSECDSLITQVNLIIDGQKAISDSLKKIRDDILINKTSKNRLPEINRKITNAADIESGFENVKKHLEAIRHFAEMGEKVTRRIIYFKRKYITYSISIQIHDENIMIMEITDGLSAKQYISNYLDEKNKNSTHSGK